jgi:hypothetical protein
MADNETGSPEPIALAEPKALELARSTCNSCVDSLDDLDWVAASTFHVGPWAVGVRSTSTDTDAALRRILAAHLLDADAPPYFSAFVPDAPPTDGNARPFNFLYRSSDSLVRTRAPGRVVRALLHYLSDLVEPAPPTLQLRATGLIVGGRAIVAPESLRTSMTLIEARLNRAGMQVIDAPVVHLEPGSGEVVVPEPRLTVDADALAAYERSHPPAGGTRELAPVAPGRYPLVAWALTTAEDAIGPIGRAEGVAAAAQQVANADTFGAQPALEVVAGALAPVGASGIWWREPAELVAQLHALTNGAAA